MTYCNNCKEEIPGDMRCYFRTASTEIYHLWCLPEDKSVVAVDCITKRIKEWEDNLVIMSRKLKQSLLDHEVHRIKLDLLHEMLKNAEDEFNETH